MRTAVSELCQEYGLNSSKAQSYLERLYTKYRGKGTKDVLDRLGFICQIAVAYGNPEEALVYFNNLTSIKPEKIELFGILREVSRLRAAHGSLTVRSLEVAIDRNVTDFKTREDIKKIFDSAEKDRPSRSSVKDESSPSWDNVVKSYED